MTLRTLLRATAPVAVAAVTLGASLTAAQASSAPGWRITKIIGSSTGSVDVASIVATRASDAWLSSSTPQGLLIERWNGGHWKDLAVPGFFTASSSKSVYSGVIGAASAHDMWTFPAVANGGSTVSYALNLDNGKWKSFRLSGAAGIFSTAVFGSSDAWAFGQVPAGPDTLGFGPPYAARYNGRAWERVSMPGDAFSVSPLSANDMWAFGPTAKTAGAYLPDMVAMHWNGKSWGSLAVPRYEVYGQRTIADGFIALGPSNLWAVEGVPAKLDSSKPPAPGIVLAHWNGHRWSKAIKNASFINQGGSLVGDGHGGLWLQGDAASTQTDDFLHYSAGRLSPVTEPALTGYSGTIFTMAQIPGTTSVWATGNPRQTTGARNTVVTVLKYGR